jgi:hypothetical protein
MKLQASNSTLFEQHLLYLNTKAKSSIHRANAGSGVPSQTGHSDASPKQSGFVISATLTQIAEILADQW